MSTYPLNKIILFEYDQPINLDNLLSAEAGLWSWVMTNTATGVTDDYAVTGYYDYQQSSKYVIKSLRVDGVDFSKVSSLADCRETDSSFFYDTTTTKMYIHFADFEPPLNKVILYGATRGYSKLPSGKTNPTYNANYYEPRLLSVPPIKKEIDPLFFGILKFSIGSVTLINTDGYFDNWRSLNLYGQPARILVGDIDDDYEDFEQVHSGYISDDRRSFEEIIIEIEDDRRVLTQPVATNILNKTDWPYLSETNVGKVKPVVYGSVFNAPCICLNQEETAPSFYTFLLCDTEFNPFYFPLTIYLDIYVDGVLFGNPYSENTAAGTFVMQSSDVVGNLDNVTASFWGTSIVKGTDIIVDLMENYENKPLNSSFWDLTEMTEATTNSRTTSVYIDSGSTKLIDVIEEVCFDIDARFFTKNSGLLTIRLYDEDKTPNTKELYKDEFIGNPQITNNSSEFLSSVIIKYGRNIANDTYYSYENTNYRDEAYLRYKRYKVNTYETKIFTYGDALSKSNTIMNISNEVQDIIDRTTVWDNFGIEPSDFIIGTPSDRYSESSAKKIYEVMSVTNNLDNFTINLSLRYVKDA